MAQKQLSHCSATVARQEMFTGTQIADLQDSSSLALQLSATQSSSLALQLSATQDTPISPHQEKTTDQNNGNGDFSCVEDSSPEKNVYAKANVSAVLENDKKKKQPASDSEREIFFKDHSSTRKKVAGAGVIKKAVRRGIQFDEGPSSNSLHTLSTKTRKKRFSSAPSNESRLSHSQPDPDVFRDGIETTQENVSLSEPHDFRCGETNFSPFLSARSKFTSSSEEEEHTDPPRKKRNKKRKRTEIGEGNGKTAGDRSSTSMVRKKKKEPSATEEKDVEPANETTDGENTAGSANGTTDGETDADSANGSTDEENHSANEATDLETDADSEKERTNGESDESPEEEATPEKKKSTSKSKAKRTADDGTLPTDKTGSHLATPNRNPRRKEVRKVPKAGRSQSDIVSNRPRNADFVKSIEATNGNKSIHPQKGKKATGCAGKMAKQKAKTKKGRKGKSSSKGGKKTSSKKKGGPRGAQPCLRDIRNQQKSTDFLIRKLPFQRLVREIMAEEHAGLRCQPAALFALQAAAEAYLVNFLQGSQALAIHARRVTVKKDDMWMLSRVALITDGNASMQDAFKHVGYESVNSYQGNYGDEKEIRKRNQQN